MGSKNKVELPVPTSECLMPTEMSIMKTPAKNGSNDKDFFAMGANGRT